MLEVAKNFEDKIMSNEPLRNDIIPYDRPINKAGPQDWKKQQECESLIKKLKQEKKERQK